MLTGNVHKTHISHRGPSVKSQFIAFSGGPQSHNSDFSPSEQTTVPFSVANPSLMDHITQSLARHSSLFSVANPSPTIFISPSNKPQSHDSHFSPSEEASVLFFQRTPVSRSHRSPSVKSGGPQSHYSDFSPPKQPSVFFKHRTSLHHTTVPRSPEEIIFFSIEPQSQFMGLGFRTCSN